MRLNYKDYDYIPDPSNPKLLSEIKRGSTKCSPWDFPKSRTLAEKLVSKFPKWRCIRELNFTSSFSVFSGQEYLGTVRVGSESFDIRNHRITAKAKRGYGMKTKDPNKAFRLICKYFYTQTSKELADGIRTEARSWVNSQHCATSSALSSMYTALTSKLKDHIIQNMDTYSQIAIANGLDPTKINRLEECFRESQTAALLDKCMANNVGSVLQRRGDGYLVSNPRGDEVLSLDDTLLPSPMRLALGKLKLVEPKTMVDGVGFRLNEDTFYILDK